MFVCEVGFERNVKRTMLSHSNRGGPRAWQVTGKNISPQEVPSINRLSNRTEFSHRIWWERFQIDVIISSLCTRITPLGEPSPQHNFPSYDFQFQIQEKV